MFTPKRSDKAVNCWSKIDDALFDEDEDCIVCFAPSNGGWWADGCAPLCKKCSNVLTNGLMERICIAKSHGPIPKLEGEFNG